MARATLAFSAPIPFVQMVEQVAYEMRISRSQLIKQAIEEYLAKLESQEKRDQTTITVDKNKKARQQKQGA